MAKVLQYQTLTEPVAPLLPVLVQSTGRTFSGLSSFTITLNGVKAGNSIVVGIGLSAGVTNPPTVTDGIGDLFTFLLSSSDGPNSTTALAFISQQVVGGNTTVTVTFNIAVTGSMYALEVANLDDNCVFNYGVGAGAGFKDLFDEGATTGTSHQCGGNSPGFNTDPSGSFIFCVGALSASVGTLTAGSGYTILASSTHQQLFQYQITSKELFSEIGVFTTNSAVSNVGLILQLKAGTPKPGGSPNPYSAAMQPQAPYLPPLSRFRHHDAYFAPVTTPAASGPTVAQIMSALQPQLDTQWQKRYPPVFAESRPVMPTPWWRWQSAGINSAAGVASQALSLLNPTVSGRAIIVGVAFYNNASATVAVTDDKGNAYAQIGSYQTSGLGRIAIFACFNITGSATPVITATPSVSCFVTLEAGEYSGLAQTGQPDGTNGATGSSTAPDTGSIPVNSANELMLSFVSQITNNTSSLVSNSGSTGLYLNNTAPMPLGVAEQNASTATDGLFTFGGSVAWLTVGASFKLTPAGSTPSVAQMMAAMQPQYLPIPPKPQFIGSDGSVEPIAPSLYPVNLGWLMQHPEATKPRPPAQTGTYSEQVDPTLYVKQKLDWYVQQPGPTVYRQPMAQTLYVQPLMPIAPLALLADTSVVSATILVSMAVNPTILVSMAVNPDT